MPFCRTSSSAGMQQTKAPCQPFVQQAWASWLLLLCHLTQQIAAHWLQQCGWAKALLAKCLSGFQRSTRLTSINRKCEPLSPAVSCRYSGFRSATSSAASRWASATSAGTGEMQLLGVGWGSGGAAQGPLCHAAGFHGGMHTLGAGWSCLKSLPSHLCHWCSRSCCPQCTPDTPADQVRVRNTRVVRQASTAKEAPPPCAVAAAHQRCRPTAEALPIWPSPGGLLQA